MSIYTRRGDNGRTDRGDERAVKCGPLFEALGTLDELAAHVGLCIHAVSQLPGAPDLGDALQPLASELLTLGALVAARNGMAPRRDDDGETLRRAVTRMETRIDADERRLGELTGFILPGGCLAACRLHAARTVCRRAERRLVAAGEAGDDIPDAALQYLNRLGDLLFCLARAANAAAGRDEVPWR